MKVRFVSEQACVKIGIQEEYQVTRVQRQERLIRIYPEEFR